MENSNTAPVSLLELENAITEELKGMNPHSRPDPLTINLSEFYTDLSILLLQLTYVKNYRETYAGIKEETIHHAPGSRGRNLLEIGTAGIDTFCKTLRSEIAGIGPRAGFTLGSEYKRILTSIIEEMAVLRLFIKVLELRAKRNFIETLKNSKVCTNSK